MRQSKRERPAGRGWLVAAALLGGALGAAARVSDEDSAERFYRLAQTQFEQGRTMEAIESLEKALSFNSDLAEAHNYLGLIYLQQSEPKRAADHLRQAVAINRYYTDAHNNLGVAYRELKKYDKAMREFQAALKDKTYRTPEKIHLNIGYLHLERGEHDRAIRAFEQSLAIDAGYLRGILGLGISYQRSGRRDLAERELRKVVQLAPDSAEAAQARQMLGGQGARDGT